MCKVRGKKKQTLSPRFQVCTLGMLIGGKKKKKKGLKRLKSLSLDIVNRFKF